MKLLLVATMLLLPPTAGAKSRVILTWQDLGNPPAARYNVFRFASSCTATLPFKRQASSLIGKTWTDTQVQPGKTYCYQVSAILAGMESPPSVSITVRVP